jgi:hypothetical protein
MKTIKILLLLLVVGYTIPLSCTAQTNTSPQPPSQLEKSRRFLMRYITFFDTIPGEEAQMSIVKGIAMVANAAPQDWIAQYQAAYHHLLMAERTADTINRKYQLERTRYYYGIAVKANPDEGEINALDVFIQLTTGKIMKLKADSSASAGLKVLEQLHKKGLSTPRSELLRAQCILALPEGKGRDEKRAREILLAALPLFDQEKHEDPAWPAWGKKQADALLQSLKK